MGQGSRIIRMSVRIVGFAAVWTIALMTSPAGLHAQQDFAFRGNWAGTFQDKTEPEYDLATRGGSSFGGASAGGRDRAISGRGRSECEGDMRLALRGPNQGLSGRGDVEQTCKSARGGTWKIPMETITLSNFEYADKGEGKDKELRFQFQIRSRTGPSSTASNELVRCEGVGKFKPKKEIFEGSYKCRHEQRQRRSGQRLMATQIRGKFKLARERGESSGLDGASGSIGVQPHLTR
jgi:hypothetical protein